MAAEPIEAVRIHPLALPIVQQLTGGDLRRMKIIETRDGLVIDMLIR
ncbi:MAG: hypothetical protein QOG52_864 [Frankiaceae bacterium]|jgi:hypothetical protein|nr:hypothetical protein [Frankiaceae bacterium]